LICWQTDASKVNLNKPVTFDLDPTKLAEAQRILTLQKAVKPRTSRKKLWKGDAAALSEILNNVSQSSFVQSSSDGCKGLLKQRSKSKQQPSKPQYLD